MLTQAIGGLGEVCVLWLWSLGGGFCSISVGKTIVAFSVMHSRAELSAYARNVRVCSQIKDLVF